MGTQRKNRLNILESLDVNSNYEAHRKKHPAVFINSSAFLSTLAATLLYDQ
jgi:hypothetical protein